jgi:parallel beta-helix repeat protein
LGIVIAILIFYSSVSVLQKSYAKEASHISVAGVDMPSRQACGEISFKADLILDSFNGNKIDVSNMGDVPIYGFKIKKIKIGATDVERLNNTNLAAGFSDTYNIGNLTGYTRTTIIPIILATSADGKSQIEYACNEEYGKAIILQEEIVIGPSLKINIISPQGTYPPGTTSIDFNISTNISASWCGYSLDDSANVSMTANSSYNGFNATSADMASGHHIVIFYCNDASGKFGLNSTGFDISSALTVSLQSPADGSPTTNTVNFSCNATGSSLKNASLYGNWSGTWSLNETKTITGNFNISNFTKTLPNGYYKWNCYACNSTACVWAPANYTFNSSSSIPLTVALQSPATGSNILILPVVFSCNATSNSLKNISLYGNWSTSWHLNETRDVSGNSYSSVSFTKNISNGNYKWNCYACNNSGNCIFAPANYTTNISYSTPPTVNLLSPANGYLLPNNRFSPFCTATGTSLKNISLYGDWSGAWNLNNTYTCSGASCSKSFDVMLYQYGLDYVIPDGTYKWNCYACDNAGRCAFSSSNRTFQLYMNSNCTTLDQSNKFYFLKNDVSAGTGAFDYSCFDITANNITLDCMGYSVLGGRTGTIRALNVNYAKIMNCNIAGGSQDGLYLSNSNSSLIKNNTVSGEAEIYAGIHLIGSNNNTIVNNTGTNVDITSGSNNIIINNTFGVCSIYFSRQCINLGGSNNSAVSNTLIGFIHSTYRDYSGGINLGGLNNSATNNTLNSAKIVFSGSNSTAINNTFNNGSIRLGGSNNIAIKNALTGRNYLNGIILMSQYNNITNNATNNIIIDGGRIEISTGGANIINNTIINSMGAAINISYSGTPYSGSYTLIANNNITNNNAGCGIYSATGAISGYNITNNNINYNKCGIAVWGGSLDSTISYNNVSYSTGTGGAGDGIGLYSGCEGSNLTNNNVSFNYGSGIYIDNGALRNNFTNNIVSYNKQHGIYIMRYISTDGYNNLTSNTINNNSGSGIVLYVGYNTLSNNTINNNSGSGIILPGAEGSWNNIINNTANYNGVNGIHLGWRINFNNITRNTANYNGQAGIYMGSQCNWSTLTNNTVKYNKENGIFFVCSSSNTITYLTSCSNTLRDINCSSECSSSSNSFSTGNKCTNKNCGSCQTSCP